MKRKGRPRGSKNAAKIVTVANRIRHKIVRKGPTEHNPSSFYTQGYLDGFIAARRAIEQISDHTRRGIRLDTRR